LFVDEEFVDAYLRGSLPKDRTCRLRFAYPWLRNDLPSHTTMGHGAQELECNSRWIHADVSTIFGS